MNTKASGACPVIWSALRTLFSGGGIPQPTTITSLPSAISPQGNNLPTPTIERDSLGHSAGVDDDLTQGSSGAQQAGADARDNASQSSIDETTKDCPECKVAIVVGHSSKSQGAHSPPMDVAEWTYNNDIANRTIGLMNDQSEGKIEAKIFYRVTGGGYNKELATVYAQVNEFLADVPSAKRIAIELHYNSVEASSARFSEVLYKGDIGFAQSSAQQLAAIFGGKSHAKHYTKNPRGQRTFTNGPTNTYLMEPFFGSNPESAAIAQTEDGKAKLAQAYATALINWIR